MYLQVFSVSTFIICYQKKSGYVNDNDNQYVWIVEHMFSKNVKKKRGLNSPQSAVPNNLW